MRFRIAAAAGIAVLLSAGAAAGLDAPGRVSLVRGEALVQGAGQEEWSYLDPNVVVLPGDLVWTAPGALLEIELPGEVVLRAGPDARFEVRHLTPTPEIRQAAGPLYLCARGRADLKAALVYTPGALVELQRGSAVRVDVNLRGGTRVTVQEGSVWYEAQGESDYLFSDERIYIDPGFLPSVPVWAEGEDSFDHWASKACSGVAVQDLRMVGAGALTTAGRWTTAQGLRVWVPHVSVTWSPYRHGRWHWIPGRGWTWVPVEPWGWTTHHYGSWSFTAGVGWAWVPGSTWHGGRVAWFNGGGFYAWAPLDPWGRPVGVVGGTHITIGKLEVNVQTIVIGGREGIEEGIVAPDHDLPNHIGPISDPYAILAQADPAPPPEAPRRGGRFSDPEVGEARSRARVLAQRVALRSGGEPDEKTRSFRVRLAGNETPETTATEGSGSATGGWAGVGFSGMAGLPTTRSSRASWEEAEVMLPEAQGADPTGEAQASSRRDRFHGRTSGPSATEPGGASLTTNKTVRPLVTPAGAWDDGSVSTRVRRRESPSRDRKAKASGTITPSPRRSSFQSRKPSQPPKEPEAKEEPVRDTDSQRQRFR